MAALAHEAELRMTRAKHNGRDALEIELGDSLPVLNYGQVKYASFFFDP